MKNLESLKSNKCNMQRVIGGDIPTDERAKINKLLETHITATYVRAGSALDHWNQSIGGDKSQSGHSIELDK